MTCRTTTPLTDEERAALEYARRRGGTLRRNEAGWGDEELDVDHLDRLFSTRTVKALVARKVMTWTDREYRGNTQRPIEASIVEGDA
jgi:hypothetical protein